MDISFVLLTWNSEAYIEKCLQSVLDDLGKGDYDSEIFIVDNGSHDNTVPMLKTFQANFPERIFPIFLEKNTGTTYSRNLALKRAAGDYICVMDSDIEVSPGVSEHLIRTLNARDHAGLVAPRLVYPNGNLQKSTDLFPTVLTKFFRYFFLKMVEEREHTLETEEMLQKSAVQEIDYAISAMWMLRRDVLDKVGLLDEKIFYAPEDVDYCLRIWKAGYTILYDPHVSCVHHTQEISRGMRINTAAVNHILGLGYYFKKHKYLFRRPKNIRKASS